MSPEELARQKQEMETRLLMRILEIRFKAEMEWMLEKFKKHNFSLAVSPTNVVKSLQRGSAPSEGMRSKTLGEGYHGRWDKLTEWDKEWLAGNKIGS